MKRRKRKFVTRTYNLLESQVKEIEETLPDHLIMAQYVREIVSLGLKTYQKTNKV